MRLTGKVALITGGNSGIGKAIAAAFADEGAKVVISGRRLEVGIEATKIGADVRFVKADLSEADDCQRCVEEAVAVHGKLDILVNNAGIVVKGTAETTSETDWADTFAINVTAVWRMSKLAIPHLKAAASGPGRPGAVIINVGSDWSLVGAKNALAYCASKGAVLQMTRCMAVDHAADGIRVNCLCPGDTFVERWTTDGYFRGDGMSVTQDQANDDAKWEMPMGRVAEAKEIAAAAVFLACSDSSFMTGQPLVIDGGNTAR